MSGGLGGRIHRSVFSHDGRKQFGVEKDSKIEREMGGW